MTLRELRKALRLIGVPKDMHWLSDGLPSDRLCICQEDGKWIVYFSERGSRFDLKYFDTESEACEYFYNDLKEYGTINIDEERNKAD